MDRQLSADSNQMAIAGSGRLSENEDMLGNHQDWTQLQCKQQPQQQQQQQSQSPNAPNRRQQSLKKKLEQQQSQISLKLNLIQGEILGMRDHHLLQSTRSDPPEYSEIERRIVPVLCLKPAARMVYEETAAGAAEIDYFAAAKEIAEMLKQPRPSHANIDAFIPPPPTTTTMIC
jgi:hypothetical protein